MSKEKRLELNFSKLNTKLKNKLISFTNSDTRV